MAEFEPPPGFERVPTPQRFEPPPGFTPVEPSSTEVIDKAKGGFQVGVASAAKGAEEAMGVPATILGMGGPSPSLTIKLADWARRQFGAPPIPEENKKEYERIAGSMRVQPEKGVKTAFERAGVSSDPEAEAKRLGVPYGGDTLAGRAIKAASQATRFGTSAALTGSGIVPTALSAVGAAAGEVIGGETGAAIGSAVAPLASLLKSAPKMTIDTVRDMKNAAYARSEAANVGVDSNAMARLAGEIRTSLAGELGRRELHPQANAALRYINDQAAQGLPITSLKTIDMMRQTVKGTLYQKNGVPRTDVSDSDARLVERIIDKIDDFSRTLIPGSKDVIMGNAAVGAPALLEARALNTRYRKAETIQDLITRADTRAQAPDLAIRNEFAALMRSSRFNTFTPAEQAAIENMVNGGPITSTLRTIGRVAPIGARSGLFGVLHGMGILSSHYASKSPEAMTYAVGLALTTELAKRMSIGLARRNANEIVNMMAQGYKPPASINMQALIPAIDEALQQRE